ncbi:hypothetical protein [Paenibacillus agilis]|uniref:Uncharacterized protein n=1 Tax=Paenibacillus agilis TaxID=3020863 RepID=A0A559IDB6_9BACL|nr:hypothetical protein [Paenibacillus agilis]TVX85616.1 hypothetical protein FPZ44_25010 [Paenibacillus agilis]
MSNVTRMLLFAVGFMLFIIALGGAVEAHTEKTDMFDKADQFIYEQDLDLTPDLIVEEPYTVSGDVIRQSIYNIDEMNVIIKIHYPNGTLSYAPGLEIEKTSVTDIDIYKEYQPTYTRAADGAITQIEYMPL